MRRRIAPPHARIDAGAGHAATFTYTFRGHVHGTTSTGVTRIAGTYREDIAYTDGVAYSCTTNDQAWSALHS